MAFYFSLPTRSMDALAKYKYQSGAYTPLDTLLNPFWLRCAEQVPPWISPNALTLSGLVLQFTGFIMTLVFHPGSGLSLVYAALAFFGYQTFDAMDGKHARNTSQSTPLGALFDHGCDAVSTVMAALGVDWAILQPLPNGPGSAWPLLGLLCFIAPMISFYMAQWEHYHLQKLFTVGVTEAQFLIMSTLVLVGVAPSVFQLPWHLGLLGEADRDTITLRLAVGSFGVAFAIAQVVGNVYRTAKEAAAEGTGAGKLASVLPVILFSISAMALQSSPALGGDQSNSGHLLLFAVIGMDWAEITVRLVVAGLCKAPYPAVHLSTAPFMVLAAASYCAPSLCGGRASLYALLLWQIVVLLWTSADVIGNICRHLNLPFLAPVTAKKS